MNESLGMAFDNTKVTITAFSSPDREAVGNLTLTTPAVLQSKLPVLRDFLRGLGTQQRKCSRSGSVRCVALLDALRWTAGS